MWCVSGRRATTQRDTDTAAGTCVEGGSVFLHDYICNRKACAVYPTSTLGEGGVSGEQGRAVYAQCEGSGISKRYYTPPDRGRDLVAP
eukprot:39536-Eustigmatos_ZCMA.PRE.1